MLQLTNVKINIGLNILRRRPDNYHDIATIMVPVPWHDILEIVPAQTDCSSLSCTGLSVGCEMERNLVFKALRRMEREVEVPAVDIYLHKIVPDGAGLGGGSSDAAHTLLVLNQLFGFGFSPEKLVEMATDIGADCPFFIYNTPMLATGIGDILTPVDIRLRGYTLAIIKPPLKISTAEAYAGVTPCPTPPDLTDLTRLKPEQWRDVAVNDFEASLFPRYPILAHIKQELYNCGAAYASMSGSGSALFGIFADGDNLAERLADAARDCTLFICEM